MITGGAGFIGANATERFINMGWEVITLDNMSRRGSHLNLKRLKETYGNKFKFIKGDITKDARILEKEISKCDVVLHLAAQVAVTNSVADPVYDFKTNALGTLNVLEAVRKSKKKKPILIYSSTNKVYGDLTNLKVVEKKLRYHLDRLPDGINEEQPLDFHSPYGCSKGTADQYVRDYSRIYGLQTVVFRQSCIYGKRQFGIEDQGWVAWFVIATLLGKGIKLYGNGKQVRDVLFVDDLVSAYIKAIENIKKTSGQIYNIGGGVSNSISILELFNQLKNQHSIEVKWQYEKIRPGDQKIFISDNKKFTKHTGWKPRIGVEKGLTELIDWTKDNLKLIQSLY